MVLPWERFLQAFPPLQQRALLQFFYDSSVAFLKLPCLPFSRFELHEFAQHFLEQAQLLLGPFLVQLPLIVLQFLAHKWLFQLLRSTQQVPSQRLPLPGCALVLSVARVPLFSGPFLELPSACGFLVGAFSQPMQLDVRAAPSATLFALFCLPPSSFAPLGMLISSLGVTVGFATGSRRSLRTFCLAGKSPELRRSSCCRNRCLHKFSQLVLQ